VLQALLTVFNGPELADIIPHKNGIKKLIITNVNTDV
jgi:hypothetical protein